MSILCLDVGTKRIGIAKGDELGLAAHPLTVVVRKNLKSDLRTIAELCLEHSVSLIVVGLPLDQESKIGDSAEKIVRFVDIMDKTLKEAGLEIEIKTWDERYSTAEAEEMLIEADLSRARRREVIDKVAASLILRDYMLHHPVKKKP